MLIDEWCDADARAATEGRPYNYAREDRITARGSDYAREERDCAREDRQSMME